MTNTLSDGRPQRGDEAVKAARAWLQHAHGEDTCPVSDTDDALCLAEVLDRFAAQARLEEAKWWHEMNDENNDALRRSQCCERVAELERLARGRSSAGWEET